MSGPRSFFSQEPSSPPVHMLSQDNQIQIRNRGFSRSPNTQKNHKDMSFSRNPDDENEISGYFEQEFNKQRQRNESKNLERSTYETPHYISQSNRNNLSLNEFPGQTRQKNLSFQRNDFDNLQNGSILSYSNTNDSYAGSNQNKISNTRNNMSPRSKQFSNAQRQSSREDQRVQSPTMLQQQHWQQLRKSLEQLTPNIIDKGLKQLRQMNEVKQVGSLASPSVIFNHCVDEEEIVQNIRGLARELRNIGNMKKELKSDLEEKLYKKDDSSDKRRVSHLVFLKLFQDADEKEKKLQHLQQEKDKEIEVMQNMSAVNRRSFIILKEKKNYVKIQERVDTILQQKQIKREQLIYQKKLEEDQQMNKNNSRQNVNLDYSQSSENNDSFHNNTNNINNNHRFSDKSFTVSKLEFNANPQQSNKGYTKKQLDEFIERHERKQQQIHEQIIEKKLQKEQNEMQSATFHPKINKKSEQLTQSTWEPIEERIEKMQEKTLENRKKKCEEEYSKFRYSPLINRNSSAMANRSNRQPLNKTYNNLNRNTSPISKSFNQTQEKSQRNCDSSRKAKENNSEAFHPISSETRTENSSSVQLNQNKFIKNDSSYNISSFDNKNTQNKKNGISQSQKRLSGMSQNDNNNSSKKEEKINVNDLAKEDYLIKYAQQYMIKQDSIQEQKQSKPGSRLISNRTSQQSEIYALQDQIKQQLSQSQFSQRSRSSNPSNKLPDKKSGIQPNQNTNTKNQPKALPINNDNKFLLNLINQKKK